MTSKKQRPGRHHAPGLASDSGHARAGTDPGEGGTARGDTRSAARGSFSEREGSPLGRAHHAPLRGIAGMCMLALTLAALAPAVHAQAPDGAPGSDAGGPAAVGVVPGPVPGPTGQEGGGGAGPPGAGAGQAVPAGAVPVTGQPGGPAGAVAGAAGGAGTAGGAGQPGGMPAGLPAGVTPEMMRAFGAGAGGAMTPAPAAAGASGERTESYRIAVSGNPETAARERGRALFTTRGLGTRAAACAGCHDAAELGRVAATYPRYNDQVGDVATLGEAINSCLTRWLAAPPYPDGSRNAIALELYLRHP